jgi:porin
MLSFGKNYAQIGKIARSGTRRIILALPTAACLWAGPTLAAGPQVVAPTAEDLQPGAAESSDGFFSGLARSNALLGDMGGLRTLLSKYGMTLGVLETSEVLGNVTGGTSHGFEYEGLTQAVLQMDTQRAFGWYGGTFDVSALQYHGRNFSADRLLSLQTVNGIEADRATRLWELWYQQKFLDEDRLDVKVGQQSLDQEFMVSQNALLFVNTMFGWPMVPSADMPGGGPAYPLSTPGIRLRARPFDPITVLVGAFNGSPVTQPVITDSQAQNPSGTAFPTNGGMLAIAELQYSYPSLGTMLYADQSEPMARVYKLGVWYDTKNFADQRLDNTGLSQANPGTSGIPQNHRGDYSVYAVADQMIWQDAEEADRTINVFGRVMGTPWANRNLIDFSANFGLTMHEPFLHRDDDSVGIGMGFAKVSDAVSALDRDSNFFGGTAAPVRSRETFVELTYQYAMTPWWQLQPDFQYVFNPGGGVADPNTGQRIKNEAVLGLRTNISF